MLKIVEVHAAESAYGEYIVLQNQGLRAVLLRGWALCTDTYLEADTARFAEEMYIFRQDIALEPYARVVLFTGSGQESWAPTTDGRWAFCAYWGRSERVWTRADHVHLLHLLGSKRVQQPPSGNEELRMKIVEMAAS
ncbi:MAG TPA: hypothetical protein VKT32_16395 [Chthonomonadaceae bacterium]|nr:hypothetical protein [Chthonomonadaceae bacterium]